MLALEKIRKLKFDQLQNSGYPLYMWLGCFRRVLYLPTVAHALFHICFSFCVRLLMAKKREILKNNYGPISLYIFLKNWDEQRGKFLVYMGLCCTHVRFWCFLCNTVGRYRILEIAFARGCQIYCSAKNPGLQKYDLIWTAVAGFTTEFGNSRENCR